MTRTRKKYITNLVWFWYFETRSVWHAFFNLVVSLQICFMNFTHALTSMASSISQSQILAVISFVLVCLMNLDSNLRISFCYSKIKFLSLSKLLVVSSYWDFWDLATDDYCWWCKTISTVRRIET